MARILVTVPASTPTPQPIEAAPTGPKPRKTKAERRAAQRERERLAHLARTTRSDLAYYEAQIRSLAQPPVGRDAVAYF